MCATFQLSFEDLAEIQKIADEITEKYGREASEQCFNTDFYPKSNVPVIGRGNRAALLRWGFPMKGSSRVVFNSRAESITEKRLYQACLANRCLVPATNFYEWDKEKRKYRISVENENLFYMAGLFKKEVVEGEKVFYFTVITTTPNPQMAEIHSRMPVILTPEGAGEWLNGSADFPALLKPFEKALSVVQV